MHANSVVLECHACAAYTHAKLHAVAPKVPTRYRQVTGADGAVCLMLDRVAYLQWEGSCNI